VAEGQTEQSERSEILRRAEQACEPRTVAPQLAAEAPKNKNKLGQKKAQHL